MNHNYCIDQLHVVESDSLTEMGRAAAAAVHQRINELLAQKPEINMLFAAAPSQNKFLEELVGYADIDWSRINALHMDEYVGLAPDAPQGFGNYLKKAIFEKVPFRSIHYLNGNASDIQAECSRYAALLDTHPLDIACTGIGENGHIAFNDPHVADFHDPQTVKCVELDDTCRMQQVHDGCFMAFDEVPRRALTLTIPTIFKAAFIVCVVPGSNKAKAVFQTLRKPVATACPASVLRLHKDATLYLEQESAALL